MDIDIQRLMARLHQLGDDARDEQGVLSRAALTEQDKSGRDMLVGWMKQAGLSVSVDAIGNLFGSWRGDLDQPPLMMGSLVYAGGLDLEQALLT